MLKKMNKVEKDNVHTSTQAQTVTSIRMCKIG
jgi:hypothetical protein